MKLNRQATRRRSAPRARRRRAGGRRTSCAFWMTRAGRRYHRKQTPARQYAARNAQQHRTAIPPNNAAALAGGLRACAFFMARAWRRYFREFAATHTHPVTPINTQQHTKPNHPTRSPYPAAQQDHPARAHQNEYPPSLPPLPHPQARSTALRVGHVHEAAASSNKPHPPRPHEKMGVQQDHPSTPPVLRYALQEDEWAMCMKLLPVRDEATGATSRRLVVGTALQRGSPHSTAPLPPLPIRT